MGKKFSTDQRNRIAEKAMELGNLTIIALVIAQFLNRMIDWRAVVIGIALFIGEYFLAFQLMRGGDK